MSLSNLYRALLLGTVVAASPLLQGAAAQISTPTASMRVPFDFSFGPAHLPAGTYTVSTNGGHLARIQGSTATGLSTVMPFHNDSENEKGRAQFVRVGDRYCLRDLWIPGYDTHLHFAVRKPKHRPVLASNETAQPQEVQVALLELPR